MSTEPPTATVDNEPPESDSDEQDVADLTAQLELLNEENRRLREDYARAQRTRYRYTAIALVVVGVIAVAGSLLLGNSRTVLLALGGTGLFAGILTYYLTPERFIAARTGERVYRALSETGTALVSELGLQDTHVYVPTDETIAGTDSPARLFVPKRAEYELPATDSLSDLFVITDRDDARGVAVYPTGGPLFREFERALSTELRATPEALGEQLTDGLIEQFELVDSATVEAVTADEQVSIGISGSVYGSADRFDHPVVSFLGVGFAVGFDSPIVIETQTVDSDRADVLVTCSWEQFTWNTRRKPTPFTGGMKPT